MNKIEKALKGKNRELELVAVNFGRWGDEEVDSLFLKSTEKCYEDLQDFIARNKDNEFVHELRLYSYKRGRGCIYNRRLLQAVRA